MHHTVNLHSVWCNLKGKSHRNKWRHSGGMAEKTMAAIFGCLRCCMHGTGFNSGHVPLQNLPTVKLDTSRMGEFAWAVKCLWKPWGFNWEPQPSPAGVSRWVSCAVVHSLRLESESWQWHSLFNISLWPVQWLNNSDCSSYDVVVCKAANLLEIKGRLEKLLNKPLKWLSISDFTECEWLQCLQIWRPGTKLPTSTTTLHVYRQMRHTGILVLSYHHFKFNVHWLTALENGLII